MPGVGVTVRNLLGTILSAIILIFFVAVEVFKILSNVFSKIIFDCLRISL